MYFFFITVGMEYCFEPTESRSSVRRFSVFDLAAFQITASGTWVFRRTVQNFKNIFSHSDSGTSHLLSPRLCGKRRDRKHQTVGTRQQTSVHIERAIRHPVGTLCSSRARPARLLLCFCHKMCAEPGMSFVFGDVRDHAPQDLKILGTNLCFCALLPATSQETRDP